MPTKHPNNLLPKGLLLALLVGTVLVPALLTLSVGIVALALWTEVYGIVFGVLVLSFAATAIAGGVAAVLFVQRSVRLAEMQADFVANVSHELRTPLAGIRLVAETLEAGRGDDPSRLAVLTQMLGDEVRQLESLVERVLAWRSLGRNDRFLSAEPLQIGPLLQQAVAEVMRLPEGRLVTIDLAVSEDLPSVRAHRRYLLQAFQNLVHNAVKFGGKHGPVGIAATREGDELVVTVRDAGPGIAEAEQKRIFERFYRGASALPNVRGTGLGLDIVKHVVEECGGNVTVDSAPDRGAAFEVRLPVDPRAAMPDAADG